jgi:F-type H+-transporting ATPase subunit b
MNHEVPREVFYQLLNFTIFVGLLFFFLRKKVVALFHEREANFKQALIKAEHARQAAENQKNIIKEKLQKLESGAHTDLEKAKRDAEELKNKILAEAQEVIANLKKETERTAESEIQRAKLELREELLSGALAQAKQILKDKVNEPDQKEFVEKIQVVGQ